MFSFRTTSIQDQLDKALVSGRVGCLCTQSSFKISQMSYIQDVFRDRGNLEAVFSPEGGEFSDGRSGVNFDPALLARLDAVVVDVQDSGARGCRLTSDVIRLMETLDKFTDAPSLYIVDHPNLSGRIVEGTMPSENVPGVPRVAHRHGLTIGELAFLHHSECAMKYPLHVISASADDSAQVMPWTIAPDWDIPGFFTPWMLSGGSLWKYTNVNPGLGTPRPYEYIGAPFLTAVPVPSPQGVVMRPCSFTPAFGRYRDILCHGWQIILQTSVGYHNLLHTLDLMRCIKQNFPQFRLEEGLSRALSDSTLEGYIEGSVDFEEVRDYIKAGEQKWIRRLKKFTLYGDEPCRMK